MMGMEVGVGRGYAFADDQKFMTEVWVIRIDAWESLVKLAHYSIEDTRIGQITDSDKLILEF
jgi:DNA-directed RNA polymerase subunit alpha